MNEGYDGRLWPWAMVEGYNGGLWVGGWWGTMIEGCDGGLLSMFMVGAMAVAMMKCYDRGYDGGLWRGGYPGRPWWELWWGSMMMDNLNYDNFSAATFELCGREDGHLATLTTTWELKDGLCYSIHRHRYWVEKKKILPASPSGQNLSVKVYTFILLIYMPRVPFSCKKW